MSQQSNEYQPDLSGLPQHQAEGASSLGFACPYCRTELGSDIPCEVCEAIKQIELGERMR